MRNGSSFQRRCCGSTVVAPYEVVPERNAQNRDHLINKEMFLCAIPHPCCNPACKCTSNGTIGMWPFVEQDVAQRISLNREKGDPVTKIVNCNKEMYQKIMIQKVIPGI